MHLPVFIQDLCILLAIAGALNFIFLRFKQPLVLGYILAGALISPTWLPWPLIRDSASLHALGTLGIILLMFNLGLEFSFRRLTRVGIPVAITTLLEVGTMFALGLSAARLFGYSEINAVFLGGMLAISSTTIIVKALDEMGLKRKRFAEMIFGVLIIEDLVAILLLVALSLIASSRQISAFPLLVSAAQLVFVIGTCFLVGYFILPRLIRKAGRDGSDELLMVLALAFCLGLVVLSSRFNYSVALGAFIMGSILAESTESRRIEDSLLRVKDLFGAIFFLSVGLALDPRVLIAEWQQILLLSALVIGGKITFVTIGALVSGISLRTAIQMGCGLAQIGEFSFIIASLGMQLKVIEPKLYPIIVAVSALTTLGTPFLLRYSYGFSQRLENRLPPHTRAWLEHYHLWVQHRRNQLEGRTLFYRSLFRWFLNGLVVTAVFILTAETSSYLTERFKVVNAYTPQLSWAAAVLLSAPFVWAMLSLFRSYRATNAPMPVLPLFISRLLTIFWLGALSLLFLKARTALLITSSISILLFVLFYRRLEDSYHWFERTFLATFKDEEKTRRPTDVSRALAPWNAQLVRVKVHPNSLVAGKKLKDAELRSRFGLNVVAIQRGLKTLVAPMADELLFPDDELLVLGTDDSIDRSRDRIEHPVDTSQGLNEHELGGYRLKQVRVLETQSFQGKTIRDSKIREQYNCIVVGIERDEERLFNPDSGFVILPGDILWLVGAAAQLDQLDLEGVMAAPEPSV